ncbi:MAG: hypothetical protein K0M40_06140 [Prolixibacteraceae bacterium]|nr:hypothetical protein [Prolixibacteraceae bacterium]
MEGVAIEKMLNGATDYVFKNNLERLVPAIKRALNDYELEIKRKQVEISLQEKKEIIKAQSGKYIQINKELDFQNEEKEKRAAELIIANKELAFQNREKEKRADELFIANKELIYQNEEKEKRAAELIIANKELLFQNKEKEKRAAELNIANKELAFQNREKEKRADELIIANKELAYQNEEKEKRAAELIIANKELQFQNKEKEYRAAELIIANKELAFQNREKEKRADELIIANKELLFQNEEKENRAAELIVANKELAFQNREKEKRADELIIAKDKAEESDRLKSAFLANMSHEIRTPMNGILGFAELLKEPELTGKLQHEYIRIIQKSGTRMMNIISDIMSISKIESGQMGISISEVNINEQLKELHSFFKPEAEQKGLQIFLKNDLHSEETIVKTDRDKVYAILTNLIKNAIKFTDKGSIEFGFGSTYPATTVAGGSCRNKSCLVSTPTTALIEFYVKDTGIGIDPEKIEMIFERFRQGSESLNKKYEGAGLGLSISKAFVEMLGGKIWIEKNPELLETGNNLNGTGTTICFTIPYHT